MTRFLFSIAFVLIAVGSASAQQKPGQDACGRDASRFCRAHLSEGDMVVLSCLQQHRAKLSKACQATLAANGR
jgi:cysteine rich repeat protein